MIHPEMNVFYLIAVLGVVEKSQSSRLYNCLNCFFCGTWEEVMYFSAVFFTVCACGVCLCACLCSDDKPGNARHQRRTNHTHTSNNHQNQYPATICNHSCHPIIINHFNHYPDINIINPDVKALNNFETPPPSYLEVTAGYNQDSRHNHHNCDSGVGSHKDDLHGPCGSRGDDTRDTDGGGTCDTGDSGGSNTGGGESGGCDTVGGDSGCCDSGGGDGGGCDSGGTD